MPASGVRFAGAVGFPAQAVDPVDPEVGDTYWNTVDEVLKTWTGDEWVAGGGRSFQQVIGDGVSVSFTITHGLNRQFVDGAVYRNTAPYEKVRTTIEHTSITQAVVRFLIPPPLNAYVARFEA